MTDNKVFNLDPDNTLPSVPYWVSLTEAAEMLGVSRQHTYKLAKDRYFKTLSRVGKSHIALVSTFEINEIADARKKS